MKKALSLVLAAAMTLSLAACGSSGGSTQAPATTPAQTEAGSKAEGGESQAATEAPAANFKIGILTSTVSQAEEEYRAAEAVKEKYGDMIIHQTFPDKAASEQETTISIALSLAADPDVKAII